MSERSIGEMRQIAKMSNAHVVWELIEYRAGEPDHNTLCALIDRAVDQCTGDMSRYSKEHHTQSEDQLTVSLILQLKRMGFAADHDATSGGHCDIVITDTGNFLWLGEAKKVTGAQNAHLLGGYDQLLDRYSTGLQSQDRGSLIVYCNSMRIDEVIGSWRKHLTTQRGNVLVSDVDADNFIFESTQPHDRTGRSYSVRHKVVSIYFSPLGT